MTPIDLNELSPEDDADPFAATLQKYGGAS